MQSFITNILRVKKYKDLVQNTTIKAMIESLCVHILNGATQWVYQVSPSFFNSTSYQLFKNELIDQGFKVEERPANLSRGIRARVTLYFPDNIYNRLEG